MTGKGKIAAVVMALCIIMGLTVVPLASAYKVPGPPGSPGGKPTKPKGGDSASKDLTKDCAVSMAGYTGLELALRTPSITFKFPEAGSVSCSVSTGKFKIGFGSATNGSRGDETFLINLSNDGRMFLYNHNGQPISLTVTGKFTPANGGGGESTSTSTVVLDP